MGDINRDDLMLLLSSYENSIKLNSTLLEQQGQLVKHTNEVVEKQKKICESISKSSRIFESTIKLIEEKLTENKIDSNENYNSLKNRLTILNGSLSVVIISLIGVIFILLEKYDIIKEIAKCLKVY